MWAAPPYGGERELKRHIEGPFTLKFDIIGYMNGRFAVKVENGNTTIELLNLSDSRYDTWETIEVKSETGGTLIFESDGNNYVWIDNIHIPEAGFYDDVENGNAGWESSGWFVVFHTWSRDIPEGFEFKLLSPAGKVVQPSCSSTGSYYECIYRPSTVLDPGNWTIELSSSAERKVEVDIDAYVIYPSNGQDILSEAVNEIVERGVVAVVAAGNSGQLGERSIASPGSAEKAITVGAVDRYGRVAYFSSRGPVGYNPEYIKPDVVAPGVAVSSTWKDGSYASLSGTSMATPHVSGVAALLLEANHDLTPADIKKAIEESATDIEETGKDTKSGSGIVDAYRALKAAMNLSTAKNLPPVVAFEITPEKPVAGEGVFFKSLSYDPDGRISWVRWDFGDGTSRVAPGVLHVYNRSGEYVITVTACDDRGLENSTTTTLRVYNSTLNLWGFVRNSLDKPVVARIVAGYSESYTDDDGYYNLTIEKGSVVKFVAPGYEVYILTALEGGVHNVTLRDVTPPRIDLPAITFTNQTTLDVRVYDEETGVALVTYYVDGAESSDLTLVEGKHEIRIVAEDYDGNVAEKSLNITVDVTKPEIDILDSSWSEEGYTIYLKTSERVNLIVDGCECVVDGDGTNWKVVVTSGSSAKITAIDEAGNRNSVEVILPETEIHLVEPRGIVNESVFRFVMPMKASYEVIVDGEVVATGSGEGTVVVKADLPDGEHTWWVRVAGFESDKYSFTLDTTPPRVVSVEKTGGQVVLRPSEELKWARANGVEMQRDGEVWTCNINDSEILITMEDLAGNRGSYMYEATQEIVDFTFTPDEPRAGQQVTFKAHVEGITYKQIMWVFSNGRMRFGTTTMMTFTRPGEYTATMLILDYNNKIVAGMRKNIVVH